MNVAIYCGSSLGKKKVYEDVTKLLAQKLAQKNLNIVYGGSEQGLMGIISNESLKYKNKVTGVITYDLVDKEIENKAIDKIYKVNSMNERKEKMENLSDAFIALPGGYGTLDEMFDVLCLTQIGHHKKPCAFLNIDGFYDKLFDFLQFCVNEGFVQQKHFDMIIVSDDIDEILEKIENYKAPTNKWNN